MTWNYQNLPNRSNEIKNSTKRITATWKLSQGQDVKKTSFYDKLYYSKNSEWIFFNLISQLEWYCIYLIYKASKEAV